MSSSVQAVVFDIGNVLIKWQPERFYDRIIGSDARKRLFAAVDLHAMNQEIDRGQDFYQTIHQTSLEHPDFADAIMMWHNRWNDIAAPVIESSLALAMALKSRGHAIFILSNIGQKPFDLAKQHNPRLAAFDRIYISGALGVVKPDPEIYQKVEDDSGIPPAALLFTDDRAENLKVAAARGWQTHLFQSADTLARALVKRGLLSDAEAEIAC